MMTMLFGMLWGVGGLTFGLSMRYLGVALGQSIALGTCAGLGHHHRVPVCSTSSSPRWMPSLRSPSALSSEWWSPLLGIAIIGVAGSMKASSLSEEEKKAAVKDFNFPKGLDYRPAGWFHERMLQRRSCLRQRHTLRHFHSRYVQDTPCYLPRYTWVVS